MSLARRTYRRLHFGLRANLHSLRQEKSSSKRNSDHLYQHASMPHAQQRLSIGIGLQMSPNEIGPLAINGLLIETQA